ncbi:repressor LexA [Verrucomicrobium sp. GAS474]|uniref:transcriptional repressor LexA n=1 Tax=Verrucomicrobium sp. GAS474 TaxID=1882831 RepID=UPI000879658E|nr:transcriptional repressor LexA [Verrucomicrobium sp. GAS474]SDU04315.1 repressor LexA [Verrucomicrobium sp. GAS474]
MVFNPESSSMPAPVFTLTGSQQKVLEFIEKYSETNHRPPTIREIQRHCGFASPRAVSYIVEKLEAAQVLLREARSRGLFSTRRPTVRAQGSPEAFQLPLFDSIPAGFADPIEGGSEVEAPASLSFIPSTLGVSDPARAFAVKVKGESMIGAGIFDGDVVVLERKPAAPGDIVAALIDGECTLKRLHQRRGAYYLQAENPAYPDLEPVEELSVQGVVVGVLRRYANAA